MIRIARERDSSTRWVILTAGVGTTVLVWTTLADPINLPKMFFLVLIAAWVLGAVATSFARGSIRSTSLGQWAIIAFAAGILLAAVLTDVRYTAFFGTPQRNDGALSYLALATLAIAAMMSFDAAHSSQLRSALIVVGGFLTLYGLLQTTGHDPFKWALEYGPVMGTLGNPDFMSALVSIAAIATLWAILMKDEMRIRVGLAALLLLELFVLRRAGSIQGELAFVIGFSILVLAKLWQVKARLGLISTIAVGVCAAPVFLGFFNVGPLASHLFRSTLRNRMDYWHAAIGMFKAHPLIGVGLDRFGENYGLYAPQVQAVHGQITNNAHNVFLQLLATGGLVVVLPYLFFVGTILVTAMRAISHSRGHAQMNLISISSIWIALLLVSVISMDNLGVAVWFWISGGVLYAISRESLTVVEESLNQRGKGKTKGRQSARQEVDYVSPIVSVVLSIIVLVPLSSIWRSSSGIFDLQSNRSRLSSSQFLGKMNSVANIQPENAQTFYFLSDIAMRIQRPDLALHYTKLVLEKDPKSNFGNQMGAIAFENEKKYALAIPYRIRLIQLDPWNTANMLQLVQDYVYLKDLPHAQEWATKISMLYPLSADAKAAAALVKG